MLFKKIFYGSQNLEIKLHFWNYTKKIKKSVFPRNGRSKQGRLTRRASTFFKANLFPEKLSSLYMSFETWLKSAFLHVANHSGSFHQCQVILSMVVRPWAKKVFTGVWEEVLVYPPLNRFLHLDVMFWYDDIFYIVDSKFAYIPVLSFVTVLRVPGWFERKSQWILSSPVNYRLIPGVTRGCTTSVACW